MSEKKPPNPNPHATCEFCGEQVPVEMWGKPHGYKQCAKHLKDRVEKLEKDIIAIKRITDNIEPDFSWMT